MQNFLVKILSIFSLFLLVCCEPSTPDYYYTKGGLKYKYHDIVDQGKQPEVGDYLSVYMQWKTENDSVFYSSDQSPYHQTDLIILEKASVKGGIEEGFAMLKEGDSVTFYIDPQLFFDHYLQQELPEFLRSEKTMLLTMRLLRIQNKEDYLIEKQVWLDQLELKEFSLIDNVLDSWKAAGDSIFNFDGVYIVYDSIRLDSNYVKYLDMVQVHYIGEFTNGVQFYSTYENGFPDEFQLGKPGQTVEGLKTAISAMRYGQKAKVLIPSNLGFGEIGAIGNIIPPYTPVVYRLEILPKEELVEIK